MFPKDIHPRLLRNIQGRRFSSPGPQHDKVCNVADEIYNNNLEKFTGLIGNMDGEINQMKTHGSSLDKACGSLTVPSYRAGQKKALALADGFPGKRI